MEVCQILMSKEVLQTLIWISLNYWISSWYQHYCCSSILCSSHSSVTGSNHKNNRINSDNCTLKQNERPRGENCSNSHETVKPMIQCPAECRVIDTVDAREALKSFIFLETAWSRHWTLEDKEIICRHIQTNPSISWQHQVTAAATV